MKVHFILPVTKRKRFSLLHTIEDNTLWSCQNVCDALSYLLDNIYIRFSYKLYRQIVGIPMGTTSGPLVADLFLICFESNFMTSLSDGNQADIIEASNSTSRYFDNLLNIDNPYFEVTKFIHLCYNCLKLILQIPKPPFWIYIYLFLMVLFPPKFMINAMTLILIL